MRFKITQYIKAIYSSYWLIPVTLSILAIVLSFVTLNFDWLYSGMWAETRGILLVMGVGGARIIISTIASAVITVTAVTFSISVLILSQASSQLGQRLLPTFMRQKSTQIVLGIFIATFIYCLLILRAIPDSGEGMLLPYISIIICIILGIFCFFY